MTLLSESFFFFSKKCSFYFVLSTNLKQYVAVTGEKEAQSLLSGTPDMQYFTFSHFSSSALPLIHYFEDIFFEKISNIELLKDLRHISMHYLKKFC